MEDITAVSRYNLGDFREPRESVGILHPIAVYLSRCPIVRSIFRVKSNEQIDRCRQVYFVCNRSFRSAVISM
jgi:hypothetical protein